MLKMLKISKNLIRILLSICTLTEITMTDVVRDRLIIQILTILVQNFMNLKKKLIHSFGPHHTDFSYEIRKILSEKERKLKQKKRFQPLSEMFIHM